MLALLRDESPFQDDSLAGGKITDCGRAWKGLQLGEKLVREITAAVQEAAVAGKYFTVTASIAGTLSGCEIQVEASPGRMTPAAFRDAGLPGLADMPTPRAVCMLSIGSGIFGFPLGSPRFGFPVWENEAVTKAWRSQHAHSPPAAGEPDYYYSEIGRKRIPANPEAFEEKLREGLKLSNWIKTRSMHTHRLFQTVAALLLAGTSLHAQTTQSTFAFGSEDWSLMSLPHAPETAGYTNPFAPALRTSL